LLADEIVSRQETGPVPAPVTYSLTDYGRSVVPIVDSLRLWGRAHIARFTD
jgi:DNA-binding HxlR family transcriptional regulator